MAAKVPINVMATACAPMPRTAISYLEDKCSAILVVEPDRQIGRDNTPGEEKKKTPSQSHRSAGKRKSLNLQSIPGSPEWPCIHFPASRSRKTLPDGARHEQRQTTCVQGLLDFAGNSLALRGADVRRCR